ncbi:MAG: glycosyltransferase family 2 protein [Janthinobacterium lividum]
MNVTPPLVSVVLPVFNAGPYLQETVESILRQTLQDFELIIVDDYSTDNSLAIAKQYEATYPQRVRVLALPHNLGRSYADNRGHELARGRYIAKMDADDVALPERLQTQAAFLESHPEIDLTSSFLQAFGVSSLVYTYPISFDEVKSFLLFNMPVGNPSVFFRRSLLTSHNLHYDEDILDTFGEDYEFITRVAKVATIVNQPQSLVRYRTFPATRKADVHARRTAKADLIRARLLEQAGFHYTQHELAVHNTVAQYPYAQVGIALPEVQAWLTSLIQQNQQLNYAASTVFQKVVAERWFWACYYQPDPQVNSHQAFHRAAFAACYQPPMQLALKLWIKNTITRHFNRK